MFHRGSNARSTVVPEGLAEQLSEPARTLQVEGDVEGTMAAMVHAAPELIPGAAGVSVSVARQRHTIEARSASGELPRAVDRLQEQYGEGSCLDAAYEQRVVRVPDYRHEQRWPDFAPAALEAGVRSMLPALHRRREPGSAQRLRCGLRLVHRRVGDNGLLVAAHAAVAEQLTSTGSLPRAEP